MDAKTVVTRFLAGIRDSDPAVLGRLAEDTTWTYPGELPVSGTWTGRARIVHGFLPEIRARVRQGTRMTIELTNVVAEDEQVVAEWTSRATTRGGAEYRNHCLGVFTVRTGQIVAVREYLDTRHAEQVLFAGPATAQWGTP